MVMILQKILNPKADGSKFRLHNGQSYEEKYKIFIKKKINCETTKSKYLFNYELLRRKSRKYAYKINIKVYLYRLRFPSFWFLFIFALYIIYSVNFIDNYNAIGVKIFSTWHMTNKLSVNPRNETLHLHAYFYMYIFAFYWNTIWKLSWLHIKVKYFITVF